MTFDANYREDVVVTGDLRVRFQMVTPSDKQKLAQGFERLSGESRYRRFFSAKAALTPAELRFLTEPDGVDHLAIAAVEIDANGEEGNGVGIGRLLRIPKDPEVAEIALAVIDVRQGMGIGRMLLERLIAASAERGVRRIRCHVLAENERMRRLIQHVFGDATTFTREGEMMTGEFPVPTTTDPKQASQDTCIAPLFDLLRLIAAGSVTSVNFGVASVRHGVNWTTPRTSSEIRR